MTFNFRKIFVFDLDDTLYLERDFEKSGIEFVYNYFNINLISLESILHNRNNWIEKILMYNNKHLTKEKILQEYRNHFPNIQLFPDSKDFLNNLNSRGIEISLITDGRSISQRNKLKALSIETYFKHIIISDEIQSQKPSEINFKLVMNNRDPQDFIYIGDNPNKDFITPNKLGWTSICLLDRGNNIHKQNFKLSTEFLPHFLINSFDEINICNE